MSRSIGTLITAALSSLTMLACNAPSQNVQTTSSPPPVAATADDSGTPSPHERLTWFHSNISVKQNSDATDVKATDFSLTLIGSVKPPSIGGVALQANSVFLDGNYAYVGYNVAGSTRLGGIDVVDVSTPGKPVLVSETVFSDTNVNGIFVDGNSLFFVGATSKAGHAPAALGKISLVSHYLSGAPTLVDLSSYVGTDLFVNASQIFALSGDTGGLQIFNRNTLALQASVPLHDARSVQASADGSSIYVLQGQPGKITKIGSSGAVLANWTLGGASFAESKSTLQLGSPLLLASIGDGGFKLVCSLDGTELASQPAVSASGLSSSLTVTNGASSLPGLIFSASGEAGLYVYSFKDNGSSAQCKNVTTTYLGMLNFGKAISANAVYARNGYVFVASGLGGLKIISLSKPSDSSDESDFNN